MNGANNYGPLKTTARSMIFKEQDAGLGYRCFLTSLQQTTFKNIEGNGDIAHHEQFLHLPQCFQLCLIIILAFIEIFHVFV